MQSRTQKSTVNIVTSVISSILTLVLNYITRLIFVRYLSAAYLGINGLFSNVLSILSMADLGLATAMTFSLYKPLAQNDTERVKSLVRFFKKVYLIIAGVVFALGLGLMPFLKFIVNLESSLDHLYVYYFLFLLETTISYLFVYRTSLLKADQKTYILTVSEICLSVAIFVSRILILIFTKNYILYVAAGIILKLVCNFIQNAIATKHYPYLKEKTEQLDKDSRSAIFKNVKASFLYKFSGTIQTNTDNILISILVGTIVVGYYSNYLLVINGIVSCVSLVFTALKSSVGNFIAENSSSEEKKKLFDSIQFLNFWIVSFCSVAFVCLFKPFISISYGSQYLLENIVVWLIIANFYITNIRQTIWIFRETSGLFVQVKYLTLVTAILNVIFSIVFGYFWGIAGIIGATILAKMTYSFWREPQVLYKNVFNQSSKEYFITYFIRALITVSMCVSCYWLVELINISNWFWSIFVQIVIVAIVPNVILLLLYFKNKNFKYLLEKFKVLFKRDKNPNIPELKSDKNKKTP